jgi:hypothetical protein
MRIRVSAILVLIFSFLFSPNLYSPAFAQDTSTEAIPQKTPSNPNEKHASGQIAPATEQSADNQAPHPGRDAPLWNKGGEASAMPVIQKMKEGLLRVGNIIVNKPYNLVTFRGEVNMQEGLVEYLICGARGKLHESVLKTEAEPFHLQIALLLLGVEPGNTPLAYQGASGIPDGDPVQIWISWSGIDKKMIKHRGEDLIFNKSTDRSMQTTDWVFTGSQVIRGRFMAQVEHSIAAVYHDPYAIFDHTLSAGTDDRIFFANKSILPPKGTPVTVEIKAVKKPNDRMKNSQAPFGKPVKPNP